MSVNFFFIVVFVEVEEFKYIGVLRFEVDSEGVGVFVVILIDVVSGVVEDVKYGDNVVGGVVGVGNV